MFIKYFAVAAFSLFFLTSCQIPFAGLPNEAEVAAIADQKKGYEGYEFKDFKVTCSKKEEITKAESANGGMEKWCVRLEYIFRRPGQDKWQDADNSWTGITYQGKEFGKILLKTNGSWKTKKDEDKFCSCTGK